MYQNPGSAWSDTCCIFDWIWIRGLRSWFHMHKKYLSWWVTLSFCKSSLRTPCIFLWKAMLVWKLSFLYCFIDDEIVFKNSVDTWLIRNLFLSRCSTFLAGERYIFLTLFIYLLNCSQALPIICSIQPQHCMSTKRA